MPAGRVKHPAVPEPQAAVNVCNPDQVFAWPNAREATTAPVVGEIVSVPSLFETEATAPRAALQPNPVVVDHVRALAHVLPKAAKRGKYTRFQLVDESL